MKFSPGISSRGWWLAVLGAHLVLWGVLIFLAYANAGPYRFASCWQALIIYLPPLGIALLAIATVSLLAAVPAIRHAELRSGARFWLACQALVAILGLLASNLSSYMSVGQVACL